MSIVFFIPNVTNAPKDQVVIPTATATQEGLQPAGQANGSFPYRHVAGTGAGGRTVPVVASDCILGTDTTTGPVTYPIPAGMPAGKLFCVTDEGGAFASANCTVTFPDGSTAVLSTNRMGIIFYCNGANAYGILASTKIG